MHDIEKSKIPGYIRAHEFCINHREKLVGDQKCGCFYCGEIFAPSQIEEWIEDAQDDTALCPYCGIDAVIGESCGYPITQDFLNQMNTYWFR